jgi:transposase InsO family protein
VERSHRTDSEEFWGKRTFSNFSAAVSGLADWERLYNEERFSLALGGRTPAERLAVR